MSKTREKKVSKDGEHVALLRHCRIAPRKCRLVAELVNGRMVDDAIEVANVDPHRGAYFMHKLLVSALAGAMEKGLRGPFVVSSARVDEGPTIKRFRPRAQGRSYSIFKRTSHLVVGLKTAKVEE